MHWTSGPEVWVQDLAVSICCVLGQKLHSYSASLHPRGLMGTGRLSGKPDKMLGVNLVTD